MKYLKLFENFNTKYLGQCDIIRKLPGGEELWHKLIANEIRITKEEFLSKVDIKAILDDEEETIDNFTGKDKDTYYATSIVDGVVYYFFMTYGFEFIWKTIS